MTAHDRPTVDEIIEAIAGFLRDDMLAAVDGANRYHVLVAINLLEIAHRQLRHEGHDEVRLAQFLRDFGFADERELIGAIRARKVDMYTDGLLPALEEWVVAKVEVAKPKYLDRPLPPYDPVLGARPSGKGY